VTDSEESVRVRVVPRMVAAVAWRAH